MGPRPARARTAVDRVGTGKLRDINARFTAMVSHCVFEPEFCIPAAGRGTPVMRHWFRHNGDGQIGKNVRDARNRLWQVMPVCVDLAEPNQ